MFSLSAPPACTCSASGDPHYQTFDGQLIHFQGVCTYRLAEAWHGDYGMIVNVKNIRSTRRPEVSLTRTVYVIIGSDTIVIDQGRKITVISTTQRFAVLNVEIVYYIFEGCYCFLIFTYCLKSLYDGITVL